MKILHKILCLPVILMALAFTACDRDYDMPPLNEPKFELPADAQTITIKQLREKYAAATQSAPITIEDSLYLRARVSADDRSGNIFKTIYLQDETGGISVLVDQSSVYSDYPAGQEVIVDLKGLCVSVYGDEQQLGHPAGYLYRTPYEKFKQHIHRNGWADESKVELKEFSNISKLSDDPDANKFTVVRLIGVHFTDGGKANFAENSGYGTHDLVDQYGNSISVRTSNYAAFAATKLPVGTGNVIGVLGRFRGAWQLTIRSAEDVYGFDGVTPGEPETPDQPGDNTEGTVIFKENFGNSSVSKVNGYWPYLSDYTAFTSGLTFTDVVGKTLSVRSSNGVNNVWIPAGKDSDLKIEGIKAAGYTTLTLSYDLAANLYGGVGEQDVAAISGTFNGHEFTTPSKVLSGSAGDDSKFYTFTVELPAADATDASELHFKATGSAMSVGLRLANIKLVGKK